MRGDIAKAREMDVPREVVEGVEVIRASESGVLGQAVVWRLESWRTPKLKSVRAAIDAVAAVCGVDHATGKRSITRGDVVRVAMEHEPIEAFLASMIWGFGPTGYGASRVGAIVSNNPHLDTDLVGQIAAAVNGPEAAWDAIANDHKIRGLGPAFGTKLAYFSALAADAPKPMVLIADLNTSWAMYALVRLRRSVEWRDSYLAYVEIAHRWARDNGWSADEVEWALFRCWADPARRSDLQARLNSSF